MGPAFSPLPGSSPFLQFMQVFAMMPWAFVGFEAVANSSEEFGFSARKTLPVLAAAVVLSAAVYAALALLPVVAVPEGYASWVDYIRARPQLEGADAVCVFGAAKRLFGPRGIAFVGAAMLAGQLTGIFGAYVATSRLLYALARNDALPAWFGRLDGDANPRNAILFVMGVSVAVPFLGRTAIAWPVDVSTLGAVIAYGYTSAAAFRARGGAGGARAALGKAAGAAGVAMSAVMGLLLLVPTYLSGGALAPEAYLLLSVWCILGFLLYRREFRLDRKSRFGHSVIVWVSVVMMIFFASLMWVRQSVCAEIDGVVGRFSDDPETAGRLARLLGEMDGRLLADALVEMGLLAVTLWIMISLFGILRRREQAMAVEKAHAEETNKAKSFFFSTVSHDIRTPLNAIIGFSQMLKMGFKTQAERDQAVESILVSGKTLLCLINDILDLSKLEAGKMEVVPEPTPRGKLLKEIADSFRVAGRKPGLEVRASIPDNLPTLMLDPQRMRQIAFNLMGNASKFTHEGHIELRASFAPSSADPAEGLFRLDVEDTGCGISEKDLKRLATPYVQVGSRAARTGGTGLGLAICRQLAKAMGGDMEVTSVLGKGSTFSIVLPKAKVAEPAAAEEAPAAPAAPVRPRSGLRILVADDQKLNRMLLKTMLGRMGDFEIVEAENGKEAFETLRAGGPGRFDLVLTDRWMPEMDGEGLVDAIRAAPDLADLKVYVLTADVEMRDTYADMGFTGFLLKPATFEALQAVVS